MNLDLCHIDVICYPDIINIYLPNATWTYFISFDIIVPKYAVAVGL